MIDQPSDDELDLLEWDKKFAENNITLEKFLSEHNRGQKEKWSEMRFLARYPHLFNAFVNKLPPILQLRAAKDLLQLNFVNIENSIHAGGSISNYFQYGPKSSIKITKTLIHIILIIDIPFHRIFAPTALTHFGNEEVEEKNFFLNPMDHKPFLEYEIINRSYVTIDDLVEKTAEKSKERLIEGLILKNPVSDGILYMRIDKRNDFYSLEIFINPTGDYNMKLIQVITKHFSKHIHYVLISDAPFRSDQKLIFLCSYTGKLNKKTENHKNELLLRSRCQKIIPHSGFE